MIKKFVLFKYMCIFVIIITTKMKNIISIILFTTLSFTTFSQWDWELMDGYDKSVTLDHGFMFKTTFANSYHINKGEKIDTDTLNGDNVNSNTYSHYYFFDFDKKTLNVYSDYILIESYKIKKVKIYSINDDKLKYGDFKIKCKDRGVKSIFYINLYRKSNVFIQIKKGREMKYDLIIVDSSKGIHHKTKTDDY